VTEHVYDVSALSSGSRPICSVINATRRRCGVSLRFWRRIWMSWLTYLL